uniref:putative reverse transcriptase protein n=1 Tax=Erythrolobus coxiae TaxID=362235 RepID=UPI001FCCEEC3|nr:putative reverse transcriptase protein [Erythrolobus coxiae]UNJ19012.1 putative reverse transcriptase protein [Erythrolobus coxiae]
MLGMENSNKSTCVTVIRELANVVCPIDSGIFSHRYYVFRSINVPLYSTPISVCSFFNTCSKKRPNCFKNAVRDFSSDFSFLKNKDHFVVSVFSKECFLQVSSRKANMSLSTVRNFSSEPANSYVYEDLTDVVNSLRLLKPEKDGFYIHITTRFLANPDFLKLAYVCIENKEDNLISKSNSITLKGISQKWFEEIALRLRNGTYEFSSSCKLNIKKKSSFKLRSFIMGNIKDRVIQKAIQLVLEEIYENKEKKFSNASHGFRPNRNCHTALAQIKNKWTAIPWFININIKNTFGTINYEILINQLKRKIKDQRLFEILLKMLQTGIISFKSISNEPFYDVPQKDVLSPILANIFYHDLDNYIEKKIIYRYWKGTKATACPDYQKAISLSYAEKRLSSQKKKQLVRRKRRDAHKAGFRYTRMDGRFIRIKYVRWADNFLIGVRGPKDLVLKIQQTVIFFLKSTLQLKLNEEEPKIVDSFSGKISFLGMLIHNVPTKSLLYRKSRAIQDKKRKRDRVLSRVNALKNRQAKEFKNECLKLFRNSYKSHLKDKKFLKEDFMSLVKGSPTFGNVMNSNRDIYRNFIKDLLLVSDIKQNQNLKEFLNRWEKELSLEIENSKNENMPTSPITKTETIDRIVEILKAQHNLPAKKVRWCYLFSGTNKTQGANWKPVWIDNFCLSETTVSKLKFPVNNIYHEKYNTENIRLAIEDLLFQAEQSPFTTYAALTPNKQIINIRQTWDEEEVFGSLPPKINSNTVEIYKRLEEASIINNKKKPMCKNSLVAAEAWLIITYYNTLARDLLSYFSCVDNLNTIKKIVTYHLRYSLLHTLACKHKCSIKKVLEMYSKEIEVNGRKGKVVSFINSVVVSNQQKKFLIKNLRNPYSNLKKSFISLQRAKISHNKCAVKSCSEINDIHKHHVQE